ncbi:hypothetical protein H0H87_009228 [Tephrocybe sp. NHM501043]|nr:hypothetical protein H0H87_009228 [Tephrocybe sp. NHM501043]
MRILLQPLSFNITLSRTYRWQTENQIDQANFLDALVQLFHAVAPGSGLQLDGLIDTRKVADSRSAKRSSNSLRPHTPSQIDRESEVPPSSTTSPRLRTGSIVRAPSPNSTSRPFTQLVSNSRDLTSNPPPSGVVPPQPVGSRSKHLRPPDSYHDVPTVNPEATSYSPILERPSSPNIIPSSNLTPSQRTRSPSPGPTRPRKQSSHTVISATSGAAPRRDPNARISFYDPANQTALDRLISGESNSNVDADGDDENTSATMANVEDMIEGYEWASDDVITRKSSRGAADLIEARLLDELMALEKTVSDDIMYIQSQNRGLQVQTQNQRALLAELENLLQTVNVDQKSLVTLTQESLEKTQSMERLEEAAAQLYKALQAGRDTDMAATMERLQEYHTHNSTLLLGDTNGMIVPNGHEKPTMISHEEMETYLGRYSGLVLYLKEMDEPVYAKLSAGYFSVASGLHSTQMKAMLSVYIAFVKKASEDGQNHSFSSTPTSGVSKGAAGMRRAGTIIRSPIEGRNRDKDKAPDGDLRASEVFGLVLEQIAPAIYHENEFITDFLQINESSLTFADYMGLDNYFRRQAARAVGLSQPTLKLVRGAMDLIFGFLPAELKIWLDTVLGKDKLEVIGIIVCLERFLVDAEDRGNQFLVTTLEKQHIRLKGIFERHVKEQITDIEQTKLSSKKRQGVAHFVKHFPAYLVRVENQLIGADGLEIRANVDAAYGRIVQSIFDSLKQMAKMDGEGEDKGQLNYHVILIGMFDFEILNGVNIQVNSAENMHHFVAETSLLEVGSVDVFCRRAEAIYDENLSAYIKIILRRPFARIIDYFEGVERLLKTTAPTEVASNNIYNKSALRKVVREYNSKDIRKHVDTLFARVGKHFAEASEKMTSEESGGIVPGTVLVGVWKACEEELLRITELFSKRITQCYSDTGVTLDYTPTDVETAFRRHRIGS